MFEYKLNRLGVLSSGLFLAIPYTVFGILYSVYMAAITLAGLQMMGIGNDIPEPVGVIITAIILIVATGVSGFISGALGAIIYNVISAITGGITIGLVDVRRN